MNKFINRILVGISALALLGAALFACITSFPNVQIQYVNRFDTNKKVIMLTFDDGPIGIKEGRKPTDLMPNDDDKDYINNGQTIDDEILDVLDKKGEEYYNKSIPAVFFEQGQQIVKRVDEKNGFTKTMTRMIDDGSWIGSHTYSHAHFGNDSSWLLTDIRESYDVLDQFYKGYFGDKAKISSDTITKLDIKDGGKTIVADIPLRLGFMQTDPGRDILKYGLKIDNLINGYGGNDWQELDNAAPTACQNYFAKNNLGNYDDSKSKYDKASENEKVSEKWASFRHNVFEAEKESAKKILLNRYESNLSAGQIFVCHTRLFAKYWLPDFIDYAHEQGYAFAGMNPLNKDSFYKNYGELIN